MLLAWPFSSVNVEVSVNGDIGCDSVTNTGIDGSCVVTDETVELVEISCLVDTSVVEYKCRKGISSGCIKVAVADLVGLVLPIGLLFL